MSKKNIKQNYLLQIQKILDKVEKSKDAASHFRCLILMGDQQKQEASSFFHASQEDMKNLLLHGFRNSEEFATATANAFMQYNAELEEKEQQDKQEPSKQSQNEENQIQKD